MAIPIDVAGDVSEAGTAMAGLLLVFLGAVAVGFDSFGAEHQDAVRAKFKRHAWIALIGFAFSILAAALALLGKFISSEALVAFSGLLLVTAFCFAAVVAYLTVAEIE